MSAQNSVIVNKWLIIHAMPNGDYKLAELRCDKHAEGYTQSVIAIYSNELNLVSDAANMLVKRAVFCGDISSTEKMVTMTTEFVQSCIDGIAMLKNKEGKNVN